MRGLRVSTVTDLCAALQRQGDRHNADVFLRNSTTLAFAGLAPAAWGAFVLHEGIATDRTNAITAAMRQTGTTTVAELRASLRARGADTDADRVLAWAATLARHGAAPAAWGLVPGAGVAAARAPAAAPAPPPPSPPSLPPPPPPRPRDAGDPAAAAGSGGGGGGAARPGAATRGAVRGNLRAVPPVPPDAIARQIAQIDGLLRTRKAPTVPALVALMEMSGDLHAAGQVRDAASGLAHAGLAPAAWGGCLSRDMAEERVADIESYRTQLPAGGPAARSIAALQRALRAQGEAGIAEVIGRIAAAVARSGEAPAGWGVDADGTIR